jgi:hypothetical protein
MGNEFDSRGGRLLIDIGDGLSQGGPGFANRQFLRDDPETELIVGEPGSKIRSQRIEEIWSGLVEEAKMGAPGHFAHEV